MIGNCEVVNIEVFITNRIQEIPHRSHCRRFSAIVRSDKHGRIAAQVHGNLFELAEIKYLNVCYAHILFLLFNVRFPLPWKECQSLGDVMNAEIFAVRGSIYTLSF